MPSRRALNSPVHFQQVFRLVIREWAGSLDAYEFRLVAMILDRTLGWGKEWERITYREFVEGVYDARGKCHHGATGISNAKVRACLKALTRKGAILCGEDEHHFLRYSLNLAWQPMLRQPREKKQTRERPVKEVTTGLRIPRQGGATTNHPPATTKQGGCYVVPCIEERTKEEPYGETRAAKPRGAADVLKSVSNGGKARREEELAEALSAERPTQNEMLTAWQSAYRETFPSAPLLTVKKKELHALGGYLKKWLLQERASTFGVYLQWSVRHWREIKRRSLSKVEGAPDLPAIGFFVGFARSFESSFARRAEIEKSLSMTTKERQVERMISTGVPADVAEAEVEEQHGYADQKAELAREKAAVLRSREALRHSHRMQPPSVTARPRTRATPPSLPAVEHGEEIPESFPEWQ